jgi:glycosyltransferase involved in cell wall biosynthesis
MANDFTVGIQFNLDPGWMGGAYYLQNLLAALGTLDRARQPDVVVITHNKASYDFLAQSGYRKLSYCSREQVVADPHFRDIDLLFPFPIEEIAIPTLTWIPDFQEKHMSYLFTPGEIAGRRSEHEGYFAREGLLLSSESALADFRHFYAGFKIPTFVVPFTSFLPTNLVPIEEVRERHALPKRYFFAPNQFWVHKNHVVILAALRELKARDIEPIVCFSGKEFDPRAPGYTPFLRQKIEEWDLSEQVHFLGFMPREDQIVAMREAQAIIQPSRFEGWSTVIEDAKALNQYVIASNLDVHKEQLVRNADLFDPSDFNTLADLLAKHWQERPAVDLWDYRRNQREYGTRLLGTFRAMVMANSASTNDTPREIVSEISHSIDDSDILGLSPLVEAPDESRGLSGPSRWMESRQLLVSGSALVSRAPVLNLRLRNPVRGQTITISVGDTLVRDNVAIPEADMSDSLELFVDLSEHIGAGDIILEISQLRKQEYRHLGLLIEKIDFVAMAQ